MPNDPRRVATDLRASARELRNAMTPQERVLWERLRHRRLDGLRFRRQHPFGHFILDFACLHPLLAVELDGWVHDDTTDYDRRRDEWLRRHGWTVLRFRNEEVVTDLDGVLERIRIAARRLSGWESDEGFASLKFPHPGPPPEGEGEVRVPIEIEREEMS